MNYTHGEINDTSQRRLRSSASELIETRSQPGGFVGLAKLARRSQDLVDTLFGKLLRYRWWLLLLFVFGIALLLGAIEMINHFEPEFPNLFKPELWYRLPIYAILIPLIIWLSLGWFWRSEQSRARALQEIELLSTLERQLISTPDWDELIQTIIRYPGTVAGARWASLTLYNPDQTTFSPAACWQPDDATPTHSLSLSYEECSACLKTRPSSGESIMRCPVSSGQQSDYSYCAPLVYQDHVTALLNFDVPTDESLSKHQKKILGQAFPVMSLAISNVRLQHFVDNQAEAMETERRRIAHNLHDSLAHTIGYLRFKLDQFSEEGPQLSVADIEEDINHMRGAAEEAYGQIRGTLADLEPISQTDLSATLRELALMISERRGFAIQMECSGEPVTVSSDLQRRVLYICRETLNNVAKHANAQNVAIRLLWGKEYLSLRITDDGSGFDPSAVRGSDHLGLSIMKQRAQELNGRMIIRSSPGNGTELFLWLPTVYASIEAIE